MIEVLEDYRRILRGRGKYVVADFDKFVKWISLSSDKVYYWINDKYKQGCVRWRNSWIASAHVCYRRIGIDPYIGLKLRENLGLSPDILSFSGAVLALLKDYGQKFTRRLSDREYLEARAGFRAGFSGLANTGPIRVKQYDRNSAYGAEMLKVLPGAPIGYSSTKPSGGLYFCVGRVDNRFFREDGVWAAPLWELFTEIGKTRAERYIHYDVYDSEPISRFVNKMFSLRKRNPLAKEAIHAVYGIFGKRSGVREHCISSEDVDGWVRTNGVLVREREARSRTHQPQVAAYIAGYAGEELLRAVCEFDAVRWHTDSICTPRTVPGLGLGLGDWRLQKEGVFRAINVNNYTISK